MKTYAHIFFDFDGTLMDTSEGIFNSFDYALSAFGRPLPGHDFYRRLIGPPLLESFQHELGFSPEGAAAALRKYREYYTPQGLYQVQVYAGVPEMLRTLAEGGKRLSVATSKPEEYAKILLERHGLLSCFTFVGGSDMEERRVKKADVIRYVCAGCGLAEPGGCVMVGDRRHDMEGAKAAGLDGIGITWGFGSETELLQAGAIAVAQTPAELVSLLLCS